MPIGYVVTRVRSTLATVLDVVATLPFAVAGTVLAIGFVMSFNSGWLILTGGPLILVLAYTVRKVPFAVRSVERHPAPDRSLARGGLDQPRPLAAADLRCASSCR